MIPSLFYCWLSGQSWPLTVVWTADRIADVGLTGPALTMGCTSLGRGQGLVVGLPSFLGLGLDCCFLGSMETTHGKPVLRLGHENKIFSGLNFRHCRRPYWAWAVDWARLTSNTWLGGGWEEDAAREKEEEDVREWRNFLGRLVTSDTSTSASTSGNIQQEEDADCSMLEHRTKKKMTWKEEDVLDRCYGAVKKTTQTDVKNEQWHERRRMQRQKGRRKKTSLWYQSFNKRKMNIAFFL